jgi:hypothetical protein
MPRVRQQPPVQYASDDDNEESEASVSSASEDEEEFSRPKKNGKPKAAPSSRKRPAAALHGAESDAEDGAPPLKIAKKSAAKSKPRKAPAAAGAAASNEGSNAAAASDDDGADDDEDSSIAAGGKTTKKKPALRKKPAGGKQKQEINWNCPTCGSFQKFKHGKKYHQERGSCEKELKKKAASGGPAAFRARLALQELGAKTAAAAASGQPADKKPLVEYICSTCKASFSSSGGLKYHLERGVCQRKSAGKKPAGRERSNMILEPLRPPQDATTAVRRRAAWELHHERQPVQAVGWRGGVRAHWLEPPRWSTVQSVEDWSAEQSPPVALPQNPLRVLVKHFASAEAAAEAAAAVNATAAAAVDAALHPAKSDTPTTAASHSSESPPPLQEEIVLQPFTGTVVSPPFARPELYLNAGGAVWCMDACAGPQGQQLLAVGIEVSAMVSISKPFDHQSACRHNLVLG